MDPYHQYQWNEQNRLHNLHQHSQTMPERPMLQMYQPPYYERVARPMLLTPHPTTIQPTMFLTYQHSEYNGYVRPMTQSDPNCYETIARPIYIAPIPVDSNNCHHMTPFIQSKYCAPQISTHDYRYEQHLTQPQNYQPMANMSTHSHVSTAPSKGKQRRRFNNKGDHMNRNVPTETVSVPRKQNRRFYGNNKESSAAGSSAKVIATDTRTGIDIRNQQQKNQMKTQRNNNRRRYNANAEVKRLKNRCKFSALAAFCVVDEY